MSILELIIIGFGLAMDAFSVSLANGLNEPKMPKGKMAKVAGIFAGFQFLMPMIGWVCVSTIAQYFAAFEKMIPWIALALLGYIGGKMLLEGIRGDDDEEEGEKAAKLFNLMFGMPLKETSKSTFAGDAFEFMHAKGPGKCGHIAIRTNFVDRAMAYFKRMGFEFDESTIAYDDKTGKPKFVYFKDEICGFAIHLLQK